jgi:hypothetical protein
MQREAILRRLMFAKYLLRMATEQARKPEPVSALAVLLLHDATELTLALSAEHHNVGSKKTEFMQYFAMLDDAISPAKIAHRESMRRLNDARVGLKHHGTMPSRTEVIAFDAAVADFMRDNLTSLLEVSLEDVSLADLVMSTKARECLKRADSAFRDQNGQAAAEGISEAFARLLADYGVKDRPDSSVRREIASLAHSLDRNGEVGVSALARLAESVERLHEEVALMRQGIDTRKLTAFRALTPNTSIAMAGNARFQYSGGRTPPTLDELQFCYDFVVDAALRMEEVNAAVVTVIGDRYARSRFGGV